MAAAVPSPLSPRHPVWQLGFRPFYLLASTFAALSVGLWALQFAGLGPRYLDGPLWHAHEMVFGFALAVIVGFLFTAGRNWTGRPTPTGGALAALAALWVLARVLPVTPWGAAAAAANVAFPLAAAAALAVPLVRSRNRRNYFFVAVLVGFAASAALVHAERLGVPLRPAWVGIRLALDGVLFVLAVMGGRVIPMFTNNGVPGAGARRSVAIDRAALALVLALIVADAARLAGAPLAALLASAALAHATRLALWRPWRTRGTPLVWVLHAAYAWIPVHLALRAAAALEAVPESVATHALAVGAIGGLIVGMTTRTARGHTGRPLRADRVDVACYALVLGAAAVRVLVPLLAPALTMHAVLASAALWSAGFGLYALRYAPVLGRPRLDGKPG
jgi:uncharacterized protein involved in response to NO